MVLAEAPREQKIREDWEVAFPHFKKVFERYFDLNRKPNPRFEVQTDIAISIRERLWYMYKRVVTGKTPEFYYLPFHHLTNPNWSWVFWNDEEAKGLVSEGIDILKEVLDTVTKYLTSNDQTKEKDLIGKAAFRAVSLGDPTFVEAVFVSDDKLIGKGKAIKAAAHFSRAAILDEPRKTPFGRKRYNDNSGLGEFWSHITVGISLFAEEIAARRQATPQK